MISPAVKYPLSLSGVPIEGGKLVRFIYADESGISLKEPMAVVVGIIIHADSQWKRVETRVNSLINEFVPAEQRRGFCFHAKDLYHGTGDVFGNYSRERAIEALKRVVAIPRELQLPIVFGSIFKSDEVPNFKVKPRKLVAIYHALAFSLCAVAAERYIAEHAPGEVAQFVAENNTDTRKSIKKMHRVLRGQMLPNHKKLFNIFGDKSNAYLPLTRIVDCVHFADKDEAILLQLADACSYVLRRHWTQDKSNPYLDDIIRALCAGGPKAVPLNWKMMGNGVIHPNPLA